MGISANRIAIWLVALVGSAAAFGQSSPVLTGAAAYGDWRSDAPGVRRKITPSDMPPPYATASANSGPTIVEHPPNAWPKAPPRFVVELLATGLDNPRLIRVSPSGDLFIAESRPGRIRVLRAPQRGGKSEIRIFAEDLYQPLGSPSGRRGPTRATSILQTPTACSVSPIARAIFSRLGQPRRLSPRCRRAGIRRATSSSLQMGPACSFQ